MYSGSSIVVYIERWKNGNDNHYFAALKQVQSTLISGKKCNLGESHFLLQSIVQSLKSMFLKKFLTKRTMYNFHDSTDTFVTPTFLQFCTQKALKTGILVPKVAYDLPEFKIRPWYHRAIIHNWSMEHMCIARFAQKCQ